MGSQGVELRRPVSVVSFQLAVTDPSIENRGSHCLGVLECIFSIIRALRMGSCLSAESRNPLTDSSLTKRVKNSNGRGGLKGSSYDSRRDDTPGRRSMNGATDCASLFTQQGKKGTNQDAMVVWENFGSREDTIFCGVFDGHGPYGHMVARRVRDQLPQKINSQWEVNIRSEEVVRDISINSGGGRKSEDAALASGDDECGKSVDMQESEQQPDFIQMLKESFFKAFKFMDRELRVHRTIDCYCSGTTAVVIVKKGKDLVIGNVGDSRAILGTRDEQNCSLRAVQLTVDLKPNLPAEAERITRCKGRVFSLHDEPDVARVWLPKTDSPGLAMARAFGDFCLKDYGLISVPDMSHRRLSEKDEFIVLATDGIWDVLSNKEVVDIIDSAPTRNSAARAVVESAVRAWRVKYPTSKVDDCAVVCLFLDSTATSTSDKNGVFPSSTTTAADAATNQLQSQRAAEQGRKDDFGEAGTTSGSTPTRVKDILLPDSSDDDLVVQREDDDHCGGEDSEDIDWSALEGVSRVNTLVTLPRFMPADLD